MAMAIGGERGGVMLNLNVTPLIDVLLVLLIIFMIITPLTPKGLNALAPQPNPNAQPDPAVLARTVVISVDANRQVTINQQPITVDELGQRLVDIFKSRNERIVFIKGDPSIPFADVAEIIDIAKGAEIDKVGLITHAMEEGH